MSSSRSGLKRWVIIGVGVFIAVDLAIVLWFEMRSTATATPVSTGALDVHDAPSAEPLKAPTTTAPARTAAVAAATVASDPAAAVVPTASSEPGTAGLLKSAPSPAEMKALADSLFTAIRDNDEATLRAMAPPGAEADETTTAMFMHQRNLNHLREVAPKLETLASEKGIDEVMTFRNGEVRVKLYRATNALSGKSLSIRRTDAGQWYVAQEVYMRD